MTYRIGMLLSPNVHERIRTGYCRALEELAMGVALESCIARALVPLLGSRSEITFVLYNIEIAAPDDGLLRVELC